MEQTRIYRREDRISALPNSLLEHIVSFLPTRGAIATSVLSKRWKPIWRSQVVIYLDDRPFPDIFSFQQFFNSFITMRDNNLPILSFHVKSLRHRLHCNRDFVYAAITKGIETLIIDLLQPTTLPSIFLSTKTLSVLKLKMIDLNDDFQSVDLPSLKVLHLEYVMFNAIGNLHKILSGCPILQELECKDLRTQMPTMMHPLGIAISNLVRASVTRRTFIGLEWLHNVEHLHMYVARMPPTIRGVFHNLTHLELIFGFVDHLYGSYKWTWLKNLLQNTPNLQTLIIHDLYMNSRLLDTITIQTAKFLDTNTKLQVLKELSSCPRISPTSKLLFI
ncbi:unnamed protein product [Lathyrus sativus]|nr:unnamed protein product [Lathyrus sativus]